MSKNIIITVILIICVVAACYDYLRETFDNLNPNDNIYNTIIYNDNKYFEKFKTANKIFTNLIDNNKRIEPINVKNKILFVTFDNRSKDYIDVHNNNLIKYVKKWNHNYKFFNSCKYNVYWCKIKIVLNELINGNYDYVIWMDSDTSIKKHNIDINDVINLYDSDIIIGSDNITKYDLVNAGVFIIKNTKIGKNFLQDCINNVYNGCFNIDGTLKGMWAATCYEQGQMNLLIAEKYFKNTTVIPNKFIYNFGHCDSDAFIMHLYRGSDEARKNCLSSFYDYEDNSENDVNDVNDVNDDNSY